MSSIRLDPDVDPDHPHTRALIRYCLDHPEDYDWYIGPVIQNERPRSGWRRWLHRIIR